MSLFAWISNGRVPPVPAHREAVAGTVMPRLSSGADAPGDCFPHIFSFPASGGRIVESRRYLIGEVPSECFAPRLADQPSSDGPASCDFVPVFHSQACAAGQGARSAGKPRALTRLRAALARKGARATRWPQDDVQ